MDGKWVASMGSGGKDRQNVLIARRLGAGSSSRDARGGRERVRRNRQDWRSRSRLSLLLTPRSDARHGIRAPYDQDGRLTGNGWLLGRRVVSVEAVLAQANVELRACESEDLGGF